MDEGDGPDVQGRLVYICRTGAVGVKALRNDPREDAQHHAQHCPATLHEVAQPFGHKKMLRSSA